MKIIDFDNNFLLQARSIHTQQSRAILRNMSQVKKENSKQILEDDARSDGFVHKKEHKIIHHILSVIGIK